MHKELMDLIGWETIELAKGSQLFLRKLGPLTLAKMQRPKKIDLDRLNLLRREKHIFTLYLEPGLSHDTKTKLGWPVEPFAHSKTSLIDLARSEKALLDSFSQKTRYNITHSLKKNLLTLRATPLSKLSAQQREDFFALHDSWSKRKNVIGYSTQLLDAVLASYAAHGTLHTAYLGTELQATLLILYHDHVATYYAAFCTPTGYHTFAPTLLAWQAIQTAKSNGCDIFDFGGIYDERYPNMYKKWKGFTKFKEGFRPTPILYPSTYLKLFW